MQASQTTSATLRLPGRRERRHVWYAVGISLVLAAYRCAVALSQSPGAGYLPATRIPLAEYVTNLLFFWLLGLLALAYRDWLRAIHRETELRRILASISPDVLLIVGPDCTIQACSETVTPMFGYDPAEMVGLRTTVLYKDRREHAGTHEIRAALDLTGFHVGTAAGIRKNGTELPLEIVTSALRGEPGAVVLVRDITRRRQAEEERRDYQQRLEELVRSRTADLNRAYDLLTEELQLRKETERRILEIGSREKRRIGQTLHDTLGQELAGIGFMAKALEHKLRTGNGSPEDAAQIATLVGEAIGQARRIARGLSPVEIIEDGLVSALRQLCEDTAKVFQVRCDLSAAEPCRVHDPEVANHLYHVAQEAINNAIRHGKADHIEVLLTVGREDGRIVIRDNGAGMPAGRPAGGGLGLRIMRSRAESMAGSLEIERSASGGVEIVCDFLNRPRQPESGEAMP